METGELCTIIPLFFWNRHFSYELSFARVLYLFGSIKKCFLCLFDSIKKKLKLQQHSFGFHNDLIFINFGLKIFYQCKTKILSRNSVTEDIFDYYDISLSPSKESINGINMKHWNVIDSNFQTYFFTKFLKFLSHSLKIMFIINKQKTEKVKHLSLSCQFRSSIETKTREKKI